MAKLALTIVTAERILLAEEDVDFVSAPGTKGRLGILPQHTPLLTTLMPGELHYRQGDQQSYVACSGGFLEVAENHVIILADTAERADEIDEARAEQARQRAEAMLRERDKLSREELIRAEATLRKAVIRLKVARHRRQRPSPPLRQSEQETARERE